MTVNLNQKLREEKGLLHSETVVSKPGYITYVLSLVAEGDSAELLQRDGGLANLDIFLGGVGEF